MSDDMPSDPMTALTEQATNMHEFYLAFVQAGFTTEQAMTLLQSVMTAAIKA